MRQISILFISAILVASGCSKSNQDLLVGTWTVTKATYTPTTQSPMDIPGGVGSKITFNACSSTCTGTSTVPNSDPTFTYSLSSDGKSVYSDADTLNILELTSSNLSFSSKMSLALIEISATK